MTIRRILPVLLSTLLLNCAAYLNFERAARGAFARGDYDAAVYNACNSLRRKPDNARAQYLLADAFRVATTSHSDHVNELTTGNDKFKWDGITSEYNALVSLNRAVRDLPTLVNRAQPSGYFTIPTSDYTLALVEARNAAAEGHYQEGIRLSAFTDVDAQKQAALEFRAAVSFVPGYKDASSRFSSSRKAGTTRLALVPFEDKTGQSQRLNYLTDRIVDDITAQLLADPVATEFLEVVTRDRLEQVMREQNYQLAGFVDPTTAVSLGKMLGARDIMTGRLTQVLYNPAHTESKSVEQEATVVVRTEKYIDPADSTEKERNIEARVRAHVTVYTKSASVTITGSYSVIDVETGTVRKAESVQGDDSYTGSWATYTGDKRALSPDNASLVQLSEPQAPAEIEMVNRAAGKIGATMAASLRDFFK